MRQILSGRRGEYVPINLKEERHVCVKAMIEEAVIIETKKESHPSRMDEILFNSVKELSFKPNRTVEEDLVLAQLQAEANKRLSKI